MISVEQPRSLLAILLIVGAGITFIELQQPRYGDPTITPDANATNTTPPRIAMKADQYPRARRLVAPSGYINTDNVSIEALIGEKVVLIDFWTYSCINCQRTFPYLRGLYDKYKPYGLEIVGVHSPEFSFEKDIDNVRRATDRFNITWPVVLDNSHGTWDAYSVRSWPTKFLIGHDGFIRHRVIGERGYDETEETLRELLRERARLQNRTIDLPPAGVDRERPNFLAIATPEIYFGSAQNGDHLANGDTGETGIQTLTVPDDLTDDRLYLGGRWQVATEFARADAAPATIAISFKAKQVNMVAAANHSVPVTATLDGAPIEAAAGQDVTAGNASTVTVDEHRLYEIVDNPSGYERHTLRLTVEEPGLEAYTFTFG